MWKKIIFILHLLWLAACAAVTPAPMLAEDTPVLLTAQTVTSARIEPSVTTSVSNPEKVVLPLTATEVWDGSISPVQVADSLYGNRQILQIKIPGISVNAPVIPVGWLQSDNGSDVQWESPGASVGWVLDSGLPDEKHGNIILYGHNNIHSSIFLNLFKLAAGDEVLLITAEGEWQYQVDVVEIIPMGLDSPGEELQYLKQTITPRLTLISCYPPDGNSHRVIVVAYPLFW